MRTATGSELFSFLTCPHTTTFPLLSIFSPLEMNSIKFGRLDGPSMQNVLFRLLSASQTRACLSSLVLVTVVALSIHVQKSLVSLNVRSLISTKIFWFRCLILSRASGVLLPLTKSGWFDLLFELLQVARPRKSEAIEYLLLTDGKTWHSRGPQNGTASQQQKWLTSCLLH